MFNSSYRYIYIIIIDINLCLNSPSPLLPKIFAVFLFDHTTFSAEAERGTTLYRYINDKWVSVNISYICHVKHHMTPAIDKEALLRIHTTKRGRKKKRKVN